MFTKTGRVPRHRGAFEIFMKVCLTIASLAKVTGGPATVLQHLSDHLALQGVEVTVLTNAPASGQVEVMPRQSRVAVEHVPCSSRTVLSGFSESLSRLLAAKRFDLVHDFGIWMPTNHAVARVCKKMAMPLIVSPCGMLASWALRHKAWKKRLAWWLYQRRDLQSATLLVATADQEVRDIQCRVPGKAIALIPNGVDLPETLTSSGADEPKAKAENRVRTAVFLGRIHPVKGLKNLVEAWNRVQPAGWRCVLAGPDEVGHQAELEAWLRERKLNGDFQFTGLLADRQKWNLLSEADLFILPSFTENFGVSVVEALAAGVPVITTKGTPWSELVAQKCGWWVDLGAEPLAGALREATSLADQDRRDMGKRGRILVEQKYSWPRIAGEFVEAYQWVIGQGPLTPCVQKA